MQRGSGPALSGVEGATTSTHTGSGLGLAIVRQLAEASGGQW